MSLTLYGLGPSRSFRCLWALEEANLDYDYVNLELSSTKEGGAKSPEYLGLNIQGKVPTLVHDDFVLTESAAILSYVNDLASQEFVPNGGKEGAKYQELAFFVLAELEQPLWTTGKHKFAIPEEHRVPEVLVTAKWEFNKAVNALGKLVTLGEKPSIDSGYALGSEFSFADILVAQTINWADRFKFEVPKPLLSYRDDMYSRTAARSALERAGMV